MEVRESVLKHLMFSCCRTIVFKWMPAQHTCASSAFSDPFCSLKLACANKKFTSVVILIQQEWSLLCKLDAQLKKTPFFMGHWFLCTVAGAVSFGFARGQRFSAGRRCEKTEQNPGCGGCWAGLSDCGVRKGGCCLSCGLSRLTAPTCFVESGARSVGAAPGQTGSHP